MKTILIADDDSSLLLSCAEVLNSLQYHIHTAVDGNEALEICRTNRVDLALLDYRMPGLNGAQVCSHINDDIPVIIWSGEDCSHEAMKAGARRFFSKGGSFGELLNIISDILDE